MSQFFDELQIIEPAFNLDDIKKKSCDWLIDLLQQESLKMIMYNINEFTIHFSGFNKRKK